MSEVPSGPSPEKNDHRPRREERLEKRTERVESKLLQQEAKENQDRAEERREQALARFDAVGLDATARFRLDKARVVLDASSGTSILLHVSNDFTIQRAEKGSESAQFSAPQDFREGSTLVLSNYGEEVDHVDSVYPALDGTLSIVITRSDQAREIYTLKPKTE